MSSQTYNRDRIHLHYCHLRVSYDCYCDFHHSYAARAKSRFSVRVIRALQNEAINCAFISLLSGDFMRYVPARVTPVQGRSLTFMFAFHSGWTYQRVPSMLPSRDVLCPTPANLHRGDSNPWAKVLRCKRLFTRNSNCAAAAS